MTSRAARTGRGWAVTGVSALVAAVMHTAAGGVFPDLRAVALAAAFVGLLCTLLAGGTRARRGRRAATVRTTASVFLAQLVFHLVYSLSTGTAAVAVAGGPGAHHHTLVLLQGGGGDVGAALGPLTHVLHGGPLMAAAHGLAAVLTVVLLRHVDTAFDLTRRCAAGLMLALRVVITVKPLAPRRTVAIPAARAPQPRAPHLRSGLRYRGPPALV